MEELLKKYKYTLSSETNEWTKDIWTIRLYCGEMEAYNTPRINTPGKYYKCESTRQNLERILEEIEEFLN